ncbi:MAG: HAD family hydrolase [Desulfovibrio sp.]|jgi:phosphoglycolate phosphatase|nr:HAD family hydrolase [Desulfovibrio sp.]
MTGKDLRLPAEKPELLPVQHAPPSAKPEPFPVHLEPSPAKPELFPTKHAPPASTRSGIFREWISLLRPVPVGSLRAVFFDFDNTLSDTIPVYDEFRRKGLEALARFVPADPDAEGVSVPFMEQMAGILASLPPASAAEAEKAALAAVEEVEVAAARRSGLFPFARPVLAALRARGTATAVITRNCPEALHAVFPDLDDYCACVLTRKHVRNVKPHPEHIERALAHAGCAGRAALMVGDHVMDVEAGKRAGTYTAAVLTGESDFAGLAAAGPDIMAPDAGTLMRCLGLL